MSIPSHLKKTNWDVCPECGSHNTDHDRAADLDGDCSCCECGFIWPMYIERR